MIIAKKRLRLVNLSETSPCGCRSVRQKIVSCKTNLKMVAGSLYLPKEDKLKPRGEDAHFLCIEEKTIGVADGVGGWAKTGVDAGEYSRELMTNSTIAVLNQPKGAVDPKQVLNEAYSNTKAQGSSTACIITLIGHTLRAVNMGDSGFMVVRGGRVIYQSPIQQWSFNCPYQLGSSKKDRPDLAMELELEVEAGDVVVAGTDGLLDNMHPSEIEEIIRPCLAEDTDSDPQQLAESIANLALYNSFDKYADTPYAQAARKAGHRHRRGGKVDDITVIVAFLNPILPQQDCQMKIKLVIQSQGQNQVIRT